MEGNRSLKKIIWLYQSASIKMTAVVKYHFLVYKNMKILSPKMTRFKYLIFEFSADLSKDITYQFLKLILLVIRIFSSKMNKNTLLTILDHGN